VGARFGLFCYATKEGSEGYADFDWFSTETKYDEAIFYPETFEGYSADMLTVESLQLETDEMEVMVGNSTPLHLTATYRDGHKEEVAARAKFTTNTEGVVTIFNGQVRGLSEGIAQLTATYTDPMGNSLSTTFQVCSTFFPFGAQYINTSLFSQGTYDEATHTFKPGQWGQMGWEYPNGADMSGYKYLVIKLKKAQNCDAHLNIFTTNSIWGDCYSTNGFGSQKQIVVNLSTAKYTSGGKQGQALDTKNIHIVCFWANGNGTIVVDDMYLTNNSDYSREDASAVEIVRLDDNAPISVYTLSGQLVFRAANSSEAAMRRNMLKPGIYIQNGKKIIVQ